MPYGKGFTFFFCKALHGREDNGSPWGRWRLEIQDAFFTNSRSSSIIEFGFGFCLLLYLCLQVLFKRSSSNTFSEFETSPFYFSAFPAQGHVFF